MTFAADALEGASGLLPADAMGSWMGGSMRAVSVFGTLYEREEFSGEVTGDSGPGEEEICDERDSESDGGEEDALLPESVLPPFCCARREDCLRF